jgi:hypothetical protein
VELLGTEVSNPVACQDFLGSLLQRKVLEVEMEAGGRLFQTNKAMVRQEEHLALQVVVRPCGTRGRYRPQ